MAGTKAGGAKARETNKAKYGENFYAAIGKKGGSKSRPETRWFYQNRDAAAKAGAIGGQRSKRGPAKKNYVIE